MQRSLTYQVPEEGTTDTNELLAAAGLNDGERAELLHAGVVA